MFNNIDIKSNFHCKYHAAETENGHLEISCIIATAMTHCD
ncbi:hypothetical protein SeGA_6004 [Salmonella enterica subsp. enterica serovar Gaminara str. A4-567]|nr:hypothetical protein SeGA_6004 [Salmonella enterica subsp. enterica serovar Gaminara str. A4-567]